jgi:uncharacterized membrane protein
MNDALTPLALAGFAIAVAAVLGNLVIVATRYSSLPEQMPIHYDTLGRPDKWNGKASMWILALMPVLTFLFMTAIAVVMVRTSDASDIDEVRAGLEFSGAMIGYLSVAMLVLTLRVIAVAEQHATGIGRMFFVLFLAGIALVTILFSLFEGM